MKLKVINKYGKITKVSKASKDLVNKNVENCCNELDIGIGTYIPRKLKIFIKENDTNANGYFLRIQHPNEENWCYEDCIYTCILSIRHQTENGIKNGFGMFIFANSKLYYVEECFVFDRERLK